MENYDSNEAKYLPIGEFINRIQKKDTDLTKLHSKLDALSETSFGQFFSIALDIDGVENNTDAHKTLRSKLLHDNQVSQDMYDNDYSSRWEVAQKISGETGFTFNPAIYDSQHSRDTIEAIQELTGARLDEVEKEEMLEEMQGIYPPNVSCVSWLEGDETIVRQDSLYSIDRDLKPDHILNATEHTYTVLKGGKEKGRLSMTELSDFDILTSQKSIATETSDMPLSETSFTDRVSGGSSNEFVYIGPESPYINSQTKN